MKQLFINCCFILLIGQIYAFNVSSCPIDDVKPLDLLKPSLTIKANLYFGDEDEETSPITKTDFYLLNKSLINILKDSDFKPEFFDGKQHKLTDEDYLTATAKAFSSEDEESALIALLIKDRISKHQILTLKTDYQGQSKVKSIRNGNYYLFGIGKTEDEIFVWHFPVKIEFGSNLIEVDQHNADVVLDLEN